MTFVFKVLQKGLLRYILHTCPNLWWRSCFKCYSMDCFSTYFTHVQTCDNARVQSATEWTASVHTSHMSKPVMTFVLRATEWTASVHTSHMPKPVMMFVFKVLQNGLLRYILHTCPNLWWRSCSKCYEVDCFGTYFKPWWQSLDDVPFQNPFMSKTDQGEALLTNWCLMCMPLCGEVIWGTRRTCLGVKQICVALMLTGKRTETTFVQHECVFRSTTNLPMKIGLKGPKLC